MSVAMLRKPKQRSDQDSSDANSGYELTLHRIISLLCDHDRKHEIYRDKNGETFKVGSFTRLEALTGISKTTIRYFVDNPEWVEPKRDTYIKLAEFLNTFDPPLFDPLDLDKTPICFPDFECNGEMWEGWKMLRQLHERSAPDRSLSLVHPAQEELPAPRAEEEINPDSIHQSVSNALSALSREDLLQVFRVALEGGSKPPEGFDLSDLTGVKVSRSVEVKQVVASGSGIPPETEEVAFLKLRKMVRSHITGFMATGNDADQYPAHLLQQREDEVSPEDLEELSELIDDILLSRRPYKTPSMADLALIAELIPNEKGKKFRGNVKALMKHIGLIH
jgi:hypothetical protein